MKKKWLALSLAAMLMSGVSLGAYADTVPAGMESVTTTAPATTTTTTTTTTTPTTTTTTPTTTTAPVVNVTELTKTQAEADALKAQLESLYSQLKNTKEKAEKAEKAEKESKSKGKSASAPGQAVSEMAKLQALVKQLTAQINAKQTVLNAQNKKVAEAQAKAAKDTAEKYSQQETNNLKAIEAILKKNDPKMIVVQADHIITDNPTFKVDMPLIVKDGVVYMPKSVLEKQFGLNIKYEETTKKFITKIEGQLVEMFILQNVVEIDGVPHKIEGRPIAIDGKIYFPMNGIDKLLNVTVKWNNEYKVIIIDDLDIANPVPTPTPVVPTTPTTPQ